MAVILSADRTCDLREETFQQYGIQTVPYHIHLEKTEYLDNIDITPAEIFEVFHSKKTLPQTSAVNVGEYLEHFKTLTEQGQEVVHFCLGSALSSSYQNCVTAASELENVYVIDGKNLSTGVGLQIMDAAKMAEEGKSAKEIFEYFSTHNRCYHASFVLGTLEFLHAGGRCSSVAAIATALLNIHPSIEVCNEDGSMKVGKKYRGNQSKVIAKYVKDKLAQYKDIVRDKIFITYTEIDPQIPAMVEEIIRDTMDFDEIIHSTASCTISSHCGPGCLGILFATESPAE